MNAIELATRQYRGLVPKPIDNWEKIPTRKLKNWLTTDVCAAIETFWTQPRFQELATWSLKQFSPSSGTVPRHKLNEIQAALVTSAKSLLSIAKLKKVNKQLSLPRTRSGEKLPSDPPRYPPPFEFTYLQVRIEDIASRFWTDLVSPDDYFEPIGGWLRKVPLKREVEYADFNQWLNPDLPPIGEFIVHCLFIRLNSLLTDLGEFRTGCLRAAQDAKCPREDLLTTEREANKRLENLFQEFTILIKSGPDAKLREACVIAAQTYLAFSPIRDIHWLGIREQLVEGERASIASHLDRMRSSRFFDLIANAITQLPALNDEKGESDTEEQKAIATGALVLTENRRVFWEGKEIPYEWQRHQVAWRILWKLAKQRQSGNMTQLDDIYEKNPTKSTFANAIMRLKSSLPKTLKIKISAVRGKGAYRLDLIPSEITLFAKDPGHIESR